MASDTVQINARISRPLKERGDAALERAGYSPSQAIRKLWDFAANNAHNPRASKACSEWKRNRRSAMPKRNGLEGGRRCGKT